MINATEARDIALQSESAINYVVEQIGKKIEEAALLGKRDIDLETAMNYDKRFVPKEMELYPPELTTWQKLVVARIKKEGFQVDIMMKTVKIGGGLGSMDDDPDREEQQPFIQVRW